MKSFQHGKIPPAGSAIPLRISGDGYVVGARPMAGQLTLDQSIEVRILCPQPGDSQILEGLARFLRRRSNPRKGTFLCPQPGDSQILEGLARFLRRRSNPRKGTFLWPQPGDSQTLEGLARFMRRRSNPRKGDFPLAPAWRLSNT
jgi:hypothetical protein